MQLSDASPTKLLFVCSWNLMRSLTAEKIFSGIPGYEVRSAGTQPKARIVVNENYLRWADVILVMEKSHRKRLRRSFPGALDGKRPIVLRIPDKYQFMQPELIDELETRVARHLGPLRTAGASSQSSNIRPVVRKAPTLVPFAFITLEVAVLALGAFYFHLGSEYGHPTMEFVETCLIWALLQSSVLLLFMDRRLAISGFIVLLVCALAGSSLQVF